MTTTRIAAGVALILATAGASLAQNDGLSKDQLHDLLGAKINVVETLGFHPKLVAAVRKQNAAGLAQAEILQRDAAWQVEGINLFKNGLLNSQASDVLRHLVESNEFFTEAFLTDNQGANVALHPVTSDYWQGDEEKWIASFNGGEGQTFIGELELDDSTNTEQVQISAPVIDSDSQQTIGVLVVGVAVKRMVTDVQ